MPADFVFRILFLKDQVGICVYLFLLNFLLCIRFISQIIFIFEILTGIGKSTHKVNGSRAILNRVHERVVSVESFWRRWIEDSRCCSHHNCCEQKSKKKMSIFRIKEIVLKLYQWLRLPQYQVR